MIEEKLVQPGGVMTTQTAHDALIAAGYRQRGSYRVMLSKQEKRYIKKWRYQKGAIEVHYSQWPDGGYTVSTHIDGVKFTGGTCSTVGGIIRAMRDIEARQAERLERAYWEAREVPTVAGKPQ